MPTQRKNNKRLNQQNELPQVSLKKYLWLKDNFAYCLVITALVWGVLLSYYVQNFIGWASVLSLEPHDFCMLVLTVIVPLIFMWFFLAYVERSSSLDANARLFHDYIDNLMYPDDDASHVAKSISEALRQQVTVLQTENKRVIEQSAKLKNDLEVRVSELSDILKLLDNYSAKTLTDLNDGVKNLANRCSYVTDKTMTTADYLRESSTGLLQNSDKFLGKIVPVIDEMAALSSNIKNSINDNKNYLASAREQLSSCADLSQQYVNEMLAKTDENTRKVERSFYKAAEEYDHLYKKIDTSISSIEGRVEEQKRLIQTQTQVINNNSDLINNKMAVYGKTVTEEIDKLVKNSTELEQLIKKQVSLLKTVNHEAMAAIKGIDTVFDEKRVDIERKCETAIGSMQNVIVAINKETDRLNNFTSVTQAKNYDLQRIAETIVDKIGDVTNSLALKTDVLKGKAVEVIDKFTEASEIINHSTNKINNSTNKLLDDNKTNTKLLELQSDYINSALTNVSVIKEKLDNLRESVESASSDIAQTFDEVDKQIENIELKGKYKQKIEPVEPEFDREKMITLAKGINRVLRNSGINSEKAFERQDMFMLWERYLGGEQGAFTSVLPITNKQTSAIRKAFDDNSEFHNQVIRYLFLMDIIIKEMLSLDGGNKDELINLSVNLSFDKIYFVLVKALNSAD